MIMKKNMTRTLIAGVAALTLIGCGGGSSSTVAEDELTDQEAQDLLDELMEEVEANNPPADTETGTDPGDTTALEPGSFDIGNNPGTVPSTVLADLRTRVSSLYNDQQRYVDLVRQR